VHCELAKTPGTLVQDRTIYEDAEIFATYLHRSRRMDKRDFSAYYELYRAMRANLPPPTLLVYLQCSVRAIRRRIKKRGRHYEQDIKASYLRKLNGLYKEWIAGWDASPILVWDSERMDYLEDLVHRIEFHRAIERFL
jgi:deoxyadenosine/deoxycytidine kinase